jgi:uncharacterized protein
MDALLENLTSPAVAFFVFGVLAARLRSELTFPAPVSTALSLYLMMAIGFKGGVDLRREGVSGELLAAAGLALALAAVMPLVTFALARAATRLTRVEAAALAAHYGSVSVVTFTVAFGFLQVREVASEGYMPALLALMESPALIIAVLLAGSAAVERRRGELLHEAFTNTAVLMLLGSLLVGLLSGTDGLERMEGLLVDPFYGALTLFLLAMGLSVSRGLGELRTRGALLIPLGLVLPLIGAALGLAGAAAIGLSVGGATLLATLSASASYIAAPAAMRIALPDANPALSLPLAIGVTFPFNVVVGIPLYFSAAQSLLG